MLTRPVLATVGLTVALTLALPSTVASPALAHPQRSATAEAVRMGARAVTDTDSRHMPQAKDDRLRAVGAPPSSTPPTKTAVLRKQAKPSTSSELTASTMTLPERRARALGAVSCEDASGALCGQFEVPLDRRSDDGRRAAIDFTLFVHSGSGPATSTVWWNGGGPGPSTTRNEAWIPGYLVGDLMGTFDVLFTDVRGTGSTAPECPTLQDFEGYAPGVANHAPVAACAASIADRIDTYGSADSARDLEALRAALGIPKLDLIGNSYGAMPATAYALRFPQRTRSLIISSGVDVETTLSSKITGTAKGLNRILDLLCVRSPACSAGVPDARAALAEGVRRLRVAPPEGDSTSANQPTTIQHVRLTEPLLFNLLQESDNFFMTVAGEAPAAMVALGRGDKAPALRLAADATDLLYVTPSDVPAIVDSAGGYAAIECSDYLFPWKRGLSPAQRKVAAVVSVLPSDLSGEARPWWAAAAVVDPVYADSQQLINCNRWPDVRAEPVVPAGAVYPKVPTLVLSSDFDPRTPLESARRTAARWPNSQLLNIGGALHGAALWSCGPDRVRAFLSAPGSHQEPCDASEFPAYRAVGEFPVTSSAARPLAVDPSGANAATTKERRLAAVALEAALDANSVSTRQFFVGTGAGLRGGSAEAFADDNAYWIELTKDRFAVDVAVSGTMVYPWDGSTPTIDITFKADDGTTGHLTVEGDWSQGRSAASPSLVPVRGSIGGHQVALLLPL